ncbi:hypothetical protein [Streptomyces sp. NPDC127084]|uniref:hypothetical protein n=1 Tax=Streptomyces sp. NPDC127084 TaxID=3347133 RepID=UPI00364DD320
MDGSWCIRPQIGYVTGGVVALMAVLLVSGAPSGSAAASAVGVPLRAGADSALSVGGQASTADRPSGGSGAADGGGGSEWGIGCSARELVDAVVAANNSGGGTIRLARGCRYVLTLPEDINGGYGPNGLPAIRTAVTVIGDRSTITRSRAAGTPPFRLIEVLHDPVQDGVRGNLTLVDVTLSNGIGEGGGAVRVTGPGTATLENCAVLGNSADYRTTPGHPMGGGLDVDGGYLRLSRTTVSKNYANVGGGIGGRNAVIRLDHADVSGNEAATSAGVGAYDSNLTVTSSRVAGNRTRGGDYGAEYVPGTGGGIGLIALPGSAARASIRDTEISGNYATGSGGGLYTSRAHTEVVHSRITENATGDSGGGIYAGAGTLVLTDSVVTRNRASQGAGGLQISETPTTITDTLIRGNIPTDCLPDTLPCGQ